MRYKILDWDSDFFEFKVARIIARQLSTQELSATLSELKQQQVELAYWPTDREYEVDVITRLNGFLADRKTTFAIDLRSLNLDKIISVNIVEPFKDSNVCA